MGKNLLRLLGGAAALLAIVSPFPAQASTRTFSDGYFSFYDWTFSSSSTAGSSSTPYWGTVNGSPLYNRDIRNDVKPNSSVRGISLYNKTYDPKDGAINTLTFRIDYSCGHNNLPCVPQDFGPALEQGSNYFIYNAAAPAATSTWATTPTLSLTAGDFTNVSSAGPLNPDFSFSGKPINFGFYAGNFNHTLGEQVSDQSYDNWEIDLSTNDTGRLKICKAVAPGVAAGTPTNFTVTSSIPTNDAVSVPAGSGAGGICAPAVKLPVGTQANIAETLSGFSVSSIDVAPTQSGSANVPAGTATVSIGSGVTEVTYTDQLNSGSKGWLEICKQSGSFGVGGTFTIMPGNLGPFGVATGTCSPSIQVTAGSVVIHEAPVSGVVIGACSTFPLGRQGACAAQDSTVTVVPGNVSSETIATVTNAHHGGGGGNGNPNPNSPPQRTAPPGGRGDP